MAQENPPDWGMWALIVAVLQMLLELVDRVTVL